MATAKGGTGQSKLGGGLDAAAGLGLNSAILNTTDKVLKQLLKDCTDQKKKNTG
jgi:nanoRNase/pAp phosphatase (c-di-AMP/oligoRNAs hydrolase)